MNPNEIASYIGLAESLYEMVISHLKARGVTDEDISAVSADYRARIARREAESK